MTPDTDQQSSDRDRTGSLGMLGAAGNGPKPDRMEHAAPVGVPTAPGTADRPGTISTAGAPGMGIGGQVVSGQGGPSGVAVLPGGGTRSTGSHDGDPLALALARQAGACAMDRGPTSTGGTLQRRTGTDASTTPALGAAGGAGSGASTSGASDDMDRTDRIGL